MEDIESAVKLVKKLTDAYSQINFSGLQTRYPPLYVWDKACNNKELLSGNMFNTVPRRNHALYLHFPFCSSKCAFCQQFSCAVTARHYYDDYVGLICKELELYADRLGGHGISGLYFGGGTPTLFDFEKVFRTIAEKYKLSSPYYFNMETTPYALTKEKLRALKSMGVTRLNMGLQSLDLRVLKAINRPVLQIEIFPKIYNEALQTGFDNIGAELVCGLPEQTLESFIKDVAYLISLCPASIHIYRFMRSPFTRLFRKAGWQTEEERLTGLRMYNAGVELLEKSGYNDDGGDFISNAKHRNPFFSLHVPPYPRFFGVIAVGLSALGTHNLCAGTVLLTANVRNWKKYASLVSKRMFPIDRTCLLNTKQELIRARIISLSILGRMTRGDFLNLCPNGDFSLKVLCDRFGKEFQFLKALGKIQIADDFSEIKWDRTDLQWFRIFYSPAVLEKCTQAIEDKSFLSDFPHEFSLTADY